MGGAPGAAGGFVRRARDRHAPDDLRHPGAPEPEGAGNRRRAAGAGLRRDRGGCARAGQGQSGGPRARPPAPVAGKSGGPPGLRSGGNVTAGGRAARAVRRAVAEGLGGSVSLGVGRRLRGHGRSRRGKLLGRLVGLRPPPCGRRDGRAGGSGRAGRRDSARGGRVARAAAGFPKPRHRGGAGDDDPQGEGPRLRCGGAAGCAEGQHSFRPIFRRGGGCRLDHADAAEVGARPHPGNARGRGALGRWPALRIILHALRRADPGEARALRPAGAAVRLAGCGQGLALELAGHLHFLGRSAGRGLSVGFARLGADAVRLEPGEGNAGPARARGRGPAPGAHYAQRLEAIRRRGPARLGGGPALRQ